MYRTGDQIEVRGYGSCRVITVGACKCGAQLVFADGYPLFTVHTGDACAWFLASSPGDGARHVLGLARGFDTVSVPRAIAVEMAEFLLEHEGEYGGTPEAIGFASLVQAARKEGGK